MTASITVRLRGIVRTKAAGRYPSIQPLDIVTIALAHDDTHMNYQAICFDLDGTLWDVISSTCMAWNRVAGHYRLRETPISRSDLEGTTGRPIRDCVEVLFGDDLPISAEQLIREIESEEARSIVPDAAHFYPSVLDGIASLSRSHRLFLVSNCQDWYLERFFELSGLRPCFEAWDCHGMSGQPKGEMIGRIMSGWSANPLLYVGDTEGDWTGARAAGADFCYAAYGFGNVPDFDLRIDHFGELLGLMFASAR